MRSIQRGITTTLLVVLILATAVAVVSVSFIFSQSQEKLKVINSFEECAKYFPVMESYPEQCKTPDGRHFTKELSEEEKQRMISPLGTSSASERMSVESIDQCWERCSPERVALKEGDPCQTNTNPNYDSVSFTCAVDEDGDVRVCINGRITTAAGPDPILSKQNPPKICKSLSE